jgi:hypothetical protein
VLVVISYLFLDTYFTSKWIIDPDSAQSVIFSSCNDGLVKVPLKSSSPAYCYWYQISNVDGVPISGFAKDFYILLVIVLFLNLFSIFYFPLEFT